MEQTNNDTLNTYSKYDDISEVGFSNRTYNCLKKAKINTIKDLLAFPDHLLKNIRNMGVKSYQEVRDFKANVSIHEDKKEVNPNYDYEAWCILHKNDVLAVYAQNFDEQIEDSTLTIRTQNILRLSGFSKISEIALLTEEELGEIPGLTKTNRIEIIKLSRHNLRMHKDVIISVVGYEEGTKPELEPEPSLDTWTISDILKSSEYSEKAKEYIKWHDIAVEGMGLSVRSNNCLKSANINSLYDLFSLEYEQIRRIKNMGSMSTDEVFEKKNAILNSMKSSIVAYCKGDIDSLFDIEYIKEIVLNLYKPLGFKSLSYRRIKEHFPEEVNDGMVKKAIGQLIRDKKLEYVDFRIFRKYPSFFDVLDTQNWSDEDQRNTLLIKERFNGKTLEEIAQLPEINLTRERVRQIVSKHYKRIKNRYIAETGLTFFDEDYYQYLFENYSISRVIFSQWLGEPDRTYYYLNNNYSKGDKIIEDAVKDENIDVAIRLRLISYLNRNNIVLDGHMIERNRSAIEQYILEKYCREEIHFDKFSELYNDLLKKNDIAYDESIYYTDEIKKTRCNKFLQAPYVLWKQGMMLRYFDIDNIDKEEFLNSLQLYGYENTEISTLKLMEDHPDLMKKNDIHDQYELHNLLKKIVNPDDFKDIDFSRQPIIRFGQFDREKAIYEIICLLSPVTITDLIDYIHSEFGYEKFFIQLNMLSPFSSIYHNGIYSIDFKNIPENRIGKLKENLSEDFYFLDEIKKMYSKLFDNADLEEINPRSLKGLGFNVYSRYALQNYSSLEAYFMDLFTKPDVFDLRPIRKRFGHIVMMEQVLTNLKRNHIIFEFEPYQFINYRRISRLGVSKQDIEEYCTSVYEYVEDGFFTIRLLKNKGFTSFLDKLGFEDYFYDSLLYMDFRFISGRMFNSYVHYKGGKVSNATRNTFINSLLDNYESIEIDELIRTIKDDYGLTIDRQHIIDAVKTSDKYYDQIMNKVYKNENYYYAEFDN